MRDALLIILAVDWFLSMGLRLLTQADCRSKGGAVVHFTCIKKDAVQE